jgi:hypothetical protein
MHSASRGFLQGEVQAGDGRAGARASEDRLHSRAEVWKKILNGVVGMLSRPGQGCQQVGWKDKEDVCGWLC